MAKKAKKKVMATKTTKKRTTKKPTIIKKQNKRLAIFVILFALIGLITLLISHAETITQNMVVLPRYDTYVQSGAKANTNLNDTNTLLNSSVQGGCNKQITHECVSTVDNRTYIRFDVKTLPAGYHIKSAAMRLWATNSSPVGGIIYSTKNNWNETTLTWNNQPGATSDPLSFNGPAVAGQWLEFKLPTTKIDFGLSNSFVIQNNQQDPAGYDSRETTHAPRLALVLEKDTNNTPPPPPPPPLSGSPCEKTANTKALASFADYARLPGDQEVVVPNGTYKGLGTVTTAHAATGGACKGWLVLKAATQGGVTVDLSGSDTGLTLDGASRIMFVGFKFIKGSIHASGPDLTFWYNDMTFFQKTTDKNSSTERYAEMYSLGYSKARVLYLEGPRTRVYGTDLHNACSTMFTRDNLRDFTFQGSHAYMIGPTMEQGGNISVQCHANAIGSEQNHQYNLQFLDSVFEGRLEMESADATDSDFTVTNSWFTNSDGAGVHTSTSYHGTCHLSNLYGWNNTGQNFLFESGTNCKASDSLHNSAPAAGTTSPDAAWKAANPYESWDNFL
ncbi:MAG: hypothetical protein JWS12_77 [Candidatus Saccharibacteria bacterium]|nr:hypothetical protein [Candidatus Saccharibacteria bacterium]